MYFKVLTISNFSKEYGYCLEGLTKENEFCQYFSNTLSDYWQIIPSQHHTKIYNDIKRAYKKSKDLYFLQDIKLDNNILQLLESRDIENIRLAIELIRNKKEG